MLYPLLGMIITFYALFALLMMINLRDLLLDDHRSSAWLKKQLEA